MDWGEIISDEAIFINENFATPESAVEFIGNFFVAHHCATQEYAQAMLKVLEKYKTVIVLDDGIAMPHARPEQGALKNQLVFVQLEQSLDFGHSEFDPVRFLIGVVSTGTEQHIQLIQLIGNLVENAIQHQQFSSKQEMKDFIYQVIKQENL